MTALFPFSRILLATEGSEFDSGAQALAFALARRDARPLGVVLPVTSNPEFEMSAPQLAARADADAARRAAALTEAARAAGVEIDLALRRAAEPWQAIVDDARERAADLLVIRRRGRRGLLANLLIGEMVSKVLLNCPCPVLVAPRGSRMWSSTVLSGIDPKQADAALLGLAGAIAAATAQPLCAIAAVARASEQAEAQHALAGLLARHAAVTAEGEVRVGPAAQCLLDAAQARSAGLIVVGRQGRGRARLGSVARQVIEAADCPVLMGAESVALARQR